MSETDSLVDVQCTRWLDGAKQSKAMQYEEDLNVMQ